jgi:hypothetical protein
MVLIGHNGFDGRRLILVARCVMQDYLEAIRSRVCSVCIDGILDTGDQFVRCGLPSERICPIEAYLPEVVDVIKTINSPKIEDYVAVLRENVCAQCEQTPDGICELRLSADCALDRYFILVAEAIDAVRIRRTRQKDAQQAASV